MIWGRTVREEVDTKIFAVHGEDLSDSFTLSNPNQGGNGKVHWTVGVLAHQFAHSSNVSEIAARTATRLARAFPQ